MSKFACPRCNSINKGKPHFYQTSGYARCDSCRIGITWTSTFFERDIEIEDTYIPDGATVSPKTGRILGPETGYKAGYSFYYVAGILGFESGEKALRKNGTLPNS